MFSKHQALIFNAGSLGDRKTTNSKMPCTSSSPGMEIQKDNKILYAFDFDHTIVEKNSDLEVAIDHPLPPSVKSVYVGGNWTEYMNVVLKYLLDQGVTFNDMIEKITKMQPTDGMIDLLKKISMEQNADLLIASDSNDKFIESFLSKYEINPTKMITNQLVQNPFQLLPFEKQTSCSICPINMCKGEALKKYIEEKGSFAKVVYVGDGGNDICPALKLTSKDSVFVRKNYRLENIINKGSINDVKFDLKATIYFWDSGTEIQNVLFS